MAKKYIDAEELRKVILEYRKDSEDSHIQGEDDIYLLGYEHACDEILSLIDSLLQEQTLTDCNELQEPEVDLEKEVEKYFQGLWPGMETAEQCNTDMHFTPPAIMRLARHFYILGLKNNIPVTQITLDELAKEGEPVTEDLEKEIERRYDQAKWGYVDGFGSVCMDKGEFTRIARHFANWQKAKMLKDAVDGVMIDSLRVQIMAPLNAVIQREGLKDGDKMKILIVKED